MFLKELEVGTDVVIKATKGKVTREFTTYVTDISNNTIKFAPVREDELIVNFTSSYVTIELIVENDGKLLCFKDMHICTGRDFKGNYFHFTKDNKVSELVNRRQTPRYNINKNCLFTLGEHRKYVEAVMQDVSITGFSVLTEEDIEIGSRVRIAFTIDSSRNQLILDAHVKNVREVGRGIRKIYGCELIRENRGFSQFVMQRQREKLKVHK